MSSSTSNFTEASVPDQSGRVALVTGANTGIGYEAARVLAGKNARVLLACRSDEKAKAARDRILDIHPDADLRLVRLDLGSLESVRRAADQIAEEPRLDLLINNAGIMFPPREETAEGFESQFGVNHLGHFALNARLMDKVRATPGSRVVTVTSNAHRFGEIDFDDLHAEKRYRKMGRYCMSKLANLLYTHELQRRFETADIDAISVASHPGGSPTELSRHTAKLAMTLAAPLLAVLSHPPAKAALTTRRAATDPDAKGGDYFGPGGFLSMVGPPVLEQPSAASRDPELARRLWDISVELTGADPGL
jgi:NAD(P)-dependent dehydrogenase (short-subunit alcohol dehydrogenase family)